ncbi:unnamed protein product [Adineta steineri]|uniref:Uncharacterized protein n=1 Tax=Adineta steineri TaxID=433720 RepID=A0A815IMV0_9BILA|nr:unnamed protein product [Adineta steineri]CAF1378484.1 unnamed protein product [Adineta steineri]CAF3584767.1 unnamed protein product [Adineta steineri]CAF3707575.1 unnamed protein product [Adineta steineri]
MSSTKQQQRVILITGANKGLGFEVVKKLVNQSSNSTNDVILLGSRDIKRGQEALTKLGSPSNVHVLQLDTSSKESIIHAKDEIKQKHGGQLDVIINNAAIAPATNTSETARETMATNYYGIKLLNDNLSPLLRENGRIVNVASEVGAWTLHGVTKELQDKYISPTLTVEELDRIVEEFIPSLDSNTQDKLGYKSPSRFLVYGVSKSAVLALTQIEARQQSGSNHIFVYAVCPGYCSTDLNHHGAGSRSPELGAESILYVVNTDHKNLKQGGFYQDGKELPLIYLDEAKIKGIRELQEKAKAGK